MKPKEQTEQTTAVQKQQPLLVLAQRIDEIAAPAVELFRSRGSFADEIQVALAVRDMRAALTPEIMAPVMDLANTDLGFRTDRDPNLVDQKTGKPHVPYSVEVVRECFIEAKLRGFHPVGNEFNIISGRFYACKNGFRRKVTQWPGLTEFRDTYEVPRLVQEKGAIVKCKATWKLSGIADSVEREFPIRVNAYMGPDAILGKAERKLLKAVHDRIAGVNTPDDTEAPEEGSIPVESTVESTRSPGPLRLNQAPDMSPPPATTVSQNGKATPTVQDQLADYVTGSGFTFDDYRLLLHDVADCRESADSFGSFADVPAGVALRHLRMPAALIARLEMAARSVKGGKP